MNAETAQPHAPDFEPGATGRGDIASGARPQADSEPAKPAPVDKEQMGSEANNTAAAEPPREEDAAKPETDIGGLAGQNKPKQDQREAILRKASEDVTLLIAHLARQGNVELEKLKPALGLFRKAATGALTDDEESKFWDSYAELLKAAKPASIDALYIEKYAGSLGAPPTKLGVRQRLIRLLPFVSRSAIEQHLRTLWIIRMLSIPVFGLTLFVVAYLTLTEGIIKRTDAMVQEHTLLTGGAVAGTQIEKSILAYRDARRQQGASAPRPPPIEGAPANAAPQKQEEVMSPQEEYLIGSRRGEIENAVQFNERILSNLLLPSLRKIPETPKSSAPFQFLSLNTPVRALHAHINELLSRYILPLLAATLGVFVHILRNSSVQFRELSFTANDVSNYWPRIILGIVAGLVIGWFVGQDPSGILATISPAAVAFVTGYSVEIFFNILDSIIKALGAGSSK
jgi:hypothetical protein